MKCTHARSHIASIETENWQKRAKTSKSFVIIYKIEREKLISAWKTKQNKIKHTQKTIE